MHVCMCVCVYVMCVCFCLPNFLFFIFYFFVISWRLSHTHLFHRPSFFDRFCWPPTWVLQEWCTDWWFQQWPLVLKPPINWSLLLSSPSFCWVVISHFFVLSVLCVLCVLFVARHFKRCPSDHSTPHFAGIIWPVEAIPIGLRYISYALPTTWAAQTMRSIMSRGWGLDKPDVWHGFLIVLAWTVFFFMFAVNSVKNRLKWSWSWSWSWSTSTCALLFLDSILKCLVMLHLVFNYCRISSLFVRSFVRSFIHSFHFFTSPFSFHFISFHFIFSFQWLTCDSLELVQLGCFGRPKTVAFLCS